VTAITLDPSGHFFLTGSSDSTVLVWSLFSILAFDDIIQSWQSEQSRTPVHNLTSHRASISAICTGHSSSNSNIAISLAEDRTALVWQYTEGVLLRSYLLDDVPQCLTIDPADRAFYVGYKSGGIQMIQFYDLESIDSNIWNVISPSGHAAPIQPMKINYWPPPVSSQQAEFGAAISLCLNFDGTQVLSGHENGQIALWDVTQGQFTKELYTLPGPITNLICLKPKGFIQNPKSGIKLHSICKPKVESNTYSDIVICAELIGEINKVEQLHANVFSEALLNENFPDYLIWEAIRDTQNSAEQRKSIRSQTSGEKGSEDFISLDNTDELAGSLSSEQEIVLLKGKIEKLQRMQKERFETLDQVRRERDVLLKLLKQDEMDKT
jgi:pre-rRNA-processing protein IPI3